MALKETCNQEFVLLKEYNNICKWHNGWRSTWQEDILFAPPFRKAGNFRHTFQLNHGWGSFVRWVHIMQRPLVDLVLDVPFPNERIVRTENWQVKKPSLRLNKEIIVLGKRSCVVRGTIFPYLDKNEREWWVLVNRIQIWKLNNTQNCKQVIFSLSLCYSRLSP